MNTTIEVDWGWQFEGFKLPVLFVNAEVAERWIRAFLSARPTGEVGAHGCADGGQPWRFIAPAVITAVHDPFSDGSDSGRMRFILEQPMEFGEGPPIMHSWGSVGMYPVHALVMETTPYAGFDVFKQ